MAKAFKTKRSCIVCRKSKNAALFLATSRICLACQALSPEDKRTLREKKKDVNRSISVISGGAFETNRRKH